jgi:glycine dehydrogenase
MSSSRPTLEQLLQHDDFARRHIGPGEAEQQAMLAALGFKDLEAMTAAAVPAQIRSARPLMLPRPLTEREALDRLAVYASENRQATSLLGMGYYDTVTPPVIQRNVLENPGWYTAYTPYQAEVSQGRLEALLAFQQMVMDLTGLDLANASLLDEATAAAEAMTTMLRVGKSKSHRLLVAPDLHPQTLAVIRTRAEPLGIEVVVTDPMKEAGDYFGVIAQHPATDGRLIDVQALADRAHAKGALLTIATDLLACVLLTPPGEQGADLVVGSAQRFGVPLGYGGPHAAFFAARDAYKRQIPGRLIGVSVDRHDNTALRMALQTREQHIRREKATSNICTAQVLLANIAAFYAVWHGPEGLTTIAQRVHRLTAILAAGLTKIGCKPRYRHFFDTLAIDTPAAEAIFARATAAGINLRRLGPAALGLSLDEASTPALVALLLDLFGGKQSGLDLTRLDTETPDAIPAGQVRKTAFLTHPTFKLYRSETEMLRWLRRLEHKDIALNRSMIPLGSCTMKLNAAAEMMPITWPGLARLHPFVPRDQALGYGRLFKDLEDWLKEMTGFAAISLQPNAGSQGEYAGLIAIMRYHASRGEAHRKVCLIPASAHGTNPASAQLAGMEVVVVATAEDGSIEIDDLRAKTQQHSARLAAFMVTYPSTHGVFEAEIKEICDVIHAAGGQVYMDGANFNALVGLARPRKLGADVMHMNLHKTFCIPHGGGGPGMGPIGVAAHLVPFLPGHVVVDNGNGTDGAVSAAPWGSALILAISWAYIAMMGPHLKRATQVAILNANYIARRLAEHYPVLFTGQNGLVAHECILDLRPLKEASGIGAEDVAKRLMDYGFHAPTMSFPVAGTLMIEPTESEAKAELDRFCEAMIQIRREAAEVEKGTWPAHDNPLVLAPHTLAEVAAESWTHAYPRQVAAFPLPWIQHDKYWPSVARVDNVAGDRNVVCACPPMEDYLQAAE